MLKPFVFSLFFFLSSLPILAQDAVLLNMERLREIKEHEYFFQPELDALFLKADEYLEMEPASVMDKGMVASSGDKHDYMSQGPYWWPDPEKPDGLPYIRRDGEKNPEIDKFTDKQNLQQIISAVDALGMAYFFTEDEKYTEKATELIYTWFLDPATRMNPNLNFGQAIPGRTEGRGIGIIETRKFGYLLDGVTLIKTSEAWTDEMQLGFTAWVSDYLDWLVNSQHGKDEAVHGNNHSSWYFVQTMAMALFCGKSELAADLQQQGLKIVLDDQVESDGSQPRELARTRSWDYSTMNLQALYYYAMLSEKTGEPLWDYQDQMLRRALDYLLPYMHTTNSWPHQQIRAMEPGKLLPVLRIAASRYPDGIYGSLFQKHYSASDDVQLFLLRY
jgi:hypothetical protein